MEVCGTPHQIVEVPWAFKKSTPFQYNHHSDVIMSKMAFQIIGVSIDCSTVYSSADQRKHPTPFQYHHYNIKASHIWPVWGESTGDRSIPLTKGQWREKCFHLMTSSWFTFNSCCLFFNSCWEVVVIIEVHIYAQFSKSSTRKRDSKISNTLFYPKYGFNWSRGPSQ